MRSPLSSVFFLYSCTIALLVQPCLAINNVQRPCGKHDLDKGPNFQTKPRLFVLSDILNDPDDQQSLSRLLLYSDQLNIRGICATTSVDMRNETHPEEMTRIVRVYGSVVDNLNHHVHPNATFPQAKDLLSVISSGPK